MNSEVLVELSSREPIFHHREFGATRADFENMMDPQFWEVGASGRAYTRAEVLDVLDQRMAAPDPEPDDWSTRDFHCQALAPNLYLLTYILMQRERVTRRATIWRRAADGWKVVFHQGTPVETPKPG